MDGDIYGQNPRMICRATQRLIPARHHFHGGVYESRMLERRGFAT
jgi:hypothetical protein